MCQNSRTIYTIATITTPLLCLINKPTLLQINTFFLCKKSCQKRSRRKQEKSNKINIYHHLILIIIIIITIILWESFPARVVCVVRLVCVPESRGLLKFSQSGRCWGNGRSWQAGKSWKLVLGDMFLGE